MILRRDGVGSWVAACMLGLPWVIPIAFGPAPALLQVWFTVASAVLASFATLKAMDANLAIARGWLIAALSSCLIGGIQYSGWAGAFAPFVEFAGRGEAFGNLRQRNQFATLTSIGLIVLLCSVSGGISGSRVMQMTNMGWRLSSWLMIGALAIGNAISNSRIGLFEWLLVVAAIGRSNWKESKFRLALGALGVYLVFALCTPHITSWLLGTSTNGLIERMTQSPGCGDRGILWSNVFHLIAQKPWFGWGWGELDYAHFITLYPRERFCDLLDNAHNLPLHLAVELGIPVAVLFCSCCGWLVWLGKPWKETSASRQMAWGVLAVIGLHSLVEYPLWYGPFQLAVVLCFWLLWCGTETDVRLGHFLARGRLAAGVVAVALLALSAYAIWDYWRISQIYLPPNMRHAAYREDTLHKIQGSRLFGDQVRFAELTTTPLDEGNAAHVHALATAMLHFSPEPRVVEKVIESAVMLHKDDEALFYLQRYKTAFPEQHARWSAALRAPTPD